MSDETGTVTEELITEFPVGCSCSSKLLSPLSVTFFTHSFLVGIYYRMAIAWLSADFKTLWLMIEEYFHKSADRSVSMSCISNKNCAKASLARGDIELTNALYLVISL